MKNDNVTKQVIRKYLKSINNLMFQLFSKQLSAN